MQLWLIGSSLGLLLGGVIWFVIAHTIRKKDKAGKKPLIMAAIGAICLISSVNSYVPEHSKEVVSQESVSAPEVQTENESEPQASETVNRNV